MTEQEKPIEDTAEGSRPSPARAVTLTIDYSNGVQKTFSSIPWMDQVGALGLTALDVVKAAEKIEPGLSFQFSSDFVDRGGREVGFVVEIDGVATNGSGQEWQIYVNDKAFGSEIRNVVPGSVTKGGSPEVKAGDTVLIKLATGR